MPGDVEGTDVVPHGQVTLLIDGAMGRRRRYAVERGRQAVAQIPRAAGADASPSALRRLPAKGRRQARPATLRLLRVVRTRMEPTRQSDREAGGRSAGGSLGSPPSRDPRTRVHAGRAGRTTAASHQRMAADCCGRAIAGTGSASTRRGGQAATSRRSGPHVYSSANLYDWRDEGIALAVADDPKSDIVRGCVIEAASVA